MGAGDLLVRIGAITFLVGAVGTLATIAPLLTHSRRLPTPAYFVSMLMGVGLALALCGLLRAAMAQRHQGAVTAADAPAGPAAGPAAGPVAGPTDTPAAAAAAAVGLDDAAAVREREISGRSGSR
jgi:hypothetical protein